MKVTSQRNVVTGSSHTPLRGPNVARVGVGHALVDNCSAQQACAAIIAHAGAQGKPAYVITPNAQHIVLLEKEKRLQAIYDRADLVVADGISILIAARLYGRSLKERVTGVDIFKRLCGMAAEAGLHVFLLGGRPGSAELAAEALRQTYPRFRCTTYCPALGFEHDKAALKETARAVRSARPDILFVAFGAPKQEYWIYDHGLQLSVPVCIGVGGSFEIVGGVVPRAPRWAQDIGCEWVYRLCREPRRMWRRYLIGNLKFAAIVVRQGIRRSLLNTFLHFVTENRFAAELREVTVQPGERPFEVRNGIANHEVEGLTTPTI
jgi:N-acetylglucosaminyldiphosphoundecaprenol N-acetyl-beta-D-mannosaminyltransferase